jgi:hypothetical protein
VLYRVVREHLESLLAECDARSATGLGYPAHVEAEFRRYLSCGILANGFLRIHCDACKQDELVRRLTSCASIDRAAAHKPTFDTGPVSAFRANSSYPSSLGCTTCAMGVLTVR